MKSIVVLMFVCCLSFTSISQNDFAIKPLPRIDFDDFRQQQQPNYFTISPELKLDDQRTQPFVVDEKAESTIDNSYIKSTTDVFFAFGDNMPVAKPSGDYWNMPVAVPDSSFVYFIKEKRLSGSPSILPGDKDFR
ncbi:hypothetical protein SLH46_00580 [Draconibacterium sp. IB214405]|uniref:hypothetical protein n=1 Tax=Draconibacterium sp. IB214405 TaxID=3097352 RepID=UPI002A11B978|nr:hypothetical protein [Draconibacterium sp. IB214405]MDX8337655.1 hypothetical protein [Draconibacterium sp. IB214405]